MTGRFILRLCILLALMTGSIGSYSDAQVYSNQENALGKIKFGDRNFGVGEEIFSISYVIFNPARAHASIVAPSDRTRGGSSLARVMDDTHSLAAVNGSFLESIAEGTPAGFVQIYGQVLHKGGADDPVLDGYLCLNPGKNDIGSVDIGSYSLISIVSPKYEDCIQSGPLLALDGKPYGSERDIGQIPPMQLKKFAYEKYKRSFFGTTNYDQVILGFASSVSLHALRTALLRSRSEGGFEVRDAINLSGRSTAGLIVGSTFLRGNTDILLPNAIIVR